MRASDFQVTVDGWARGEVATASLFRGPGAAGLAAAQWKANPGGLPPRVEPSRLVVLVADQGSFLPGDERRMQAVAENCLGLLGLGDRVMFVRLPDLSGTQTASADREPVRQALRLVQPLRPRYELSAETAAEEKPPAPPVDSDPTVEAKPEEEAPTWRAALDLGDLLGGGSKQTTEPLTAPAVKAHAVEMLEGLRRLLVGLQPASAGSTILLLSAGLVATEAQPELDAVKTAAAAAFARIYAIQVPTPSARFANLGSAGLMALARDTGGTLVTLHDKPAQALQRLAGELSFSYLADACAGGRRRAPPQLLRGDTPQGCHHTDGPGHPRRPPPARGGRAARADAGRRRHIRRDAASQDRQPVVTPPLMLLSLASPTTCTTTAVKSLRSCRRKCTSKEPSLLWRPRRDRPISSPGPDGWSRTSSW